MKPTTIITIQTPQELARQIILAHVRAENTVPSVQYVREQPGLSIPEANRIIECVFKNECVEVDDDVWEVKE